MAAKRGPNVLLCMPDRTQCILLISVMPGFSVAEWNGCPAVSWAHGFDGAQSIGTAPVWQICRQVWMGPRRLDRQKCRRLDRQTCRQTCGQRGVDG
jgi:hypothetical protein